MDASDSTLLNKFAKGTEDHAFRQLVERYQDLVFAAALRRTGQRALAEEIAQEFSFCSRRRRTCSANTPPSRAGFMKQPSMRRSRPSDAGDRVLFPERRNATPTAETPSASTPIVTHFAGEIADRMHLSAEQRRRVLPLLEPHTATRRKAAKELLDSIVYHCADLSYKEGTIFSALGGHAEYINRVSGMKGLRFGRAIC